jgi:uncharacterized membrane protein YgdD (TMEM256/DUF423 family)
MDRIFFIIGSLSACMGVAAGAFGAHMLKARLQPEMLAVFEVGVRYQMYHAFALFIASWAFSKWSSVHATAGGYFFIGGTILFSGSLYLLSISGLKWLGMLTPIGGIMFMAGWICCALAALKK